MKLSDISRAAVEKLNVRWHGLAAAVVVFAVLTISGKLSLSVAAGSVTALIVWAALWPSRVTALAVEAYEARRLLDAAVRSAAVWKIIVESLPDPAVALDAEGGVLAFNSAASELFPGAAHGRHISQVTRAPELLTAVNGAIASGDVQSCRLDLRCRLSAVWLELSRR